MVTALTCPWCGAPLPGVMAGQPLATCVYCGSTASLTGATAVKARAATQHGPPAVSTTDPDLFRRVLEAFQLARGRRASPFDALVAAARERLGPMGQTDAFARVVLALGVDFDVENKTKVVDDAMCMGRLIEVYLMAIEGVRRTGSYDVNLPFFTATAKVGPLHFRRMLTAEVIAGLAAREPVKPKGLWPFG